MIGLSSVKIASNRGFPADLHDLPLNRTTANTGFDRDGGRHGLKKTAHWEPRTALTTDIADKMDFSLLIHLISSSGDFLPRGCPSNNEL